MNRVALCEMVWVLTSVHGFARDVVADMIARLLSTIEIELEDSASVHAALQTFRRGNVEFADALIGAVNRSRGCIATATFDRKAARLQDFIRVV